MIEKRDEARQQGRGEEDIELNKQIGNDAKKRIDRRKRWKS